MKLLNVACVAGVWTAYLENTADRLIEIKQADLVAFTAAVLEQQAPFQHTSAKRKIASAVERYARLQERLLDAMKDRLSAFEAGDHRREARAVAVIDGLHAKLRG